MRNRGMLLLSTLTGLVLAGCASTTEMASTTTPTEATAENGIGCPCCFTIVQAVRTGILPIDEDGHLDVTCERCCEHLVFFAQPKGELFVATGDQAPMPAELATPLR